jgi:hypothetical protein
MKDITLTYDGQTMLGQLGTKITKADLYGEVSRMVEKDGRRLERGSLMPDGRLLRRAQLTSAGVDADGSPTEELAYVTEDTQEAAISVASSFDSGLTLTRVPLTTLAGFAVADVYDLQATDLAPGLYQTEFNYRKSYQPREALLLIKDGGDSFLLIGSSKRVAFVGQHPTYEFFDTDDAEADESDPLDFSML